MSVPNTEAVRDWANAKFEEKVEGKGLSTNDYTNEDKALVDKIPVEMKATSEVSGIKSAELTDSANGHISAISLYGATKKSKNLFVPIVGSSTVLGVTFTKNSDNSYTLNGTASADISYILTSTNGSDSTPNIPLKGTYKLIGVKADEGSSKLSVQLYTKVNGAWVKAIFDFDSNPTASLDGMYFVRIFVRQGQVLNNVVVKPMITTDLTATYDDYEPYGLIIPSGKVESNGYNLFDASTPSIQNGASSILDGDTLVVRTDVASQYRSVSFDVPCKPNTNYTFSVDDIVKSGNNDARISVRGFNASGAQIATHKEIYNSGSYSFETMGNETQITLLFYSTNSIAGTVGETIRYSKCMLRLSENQNENYVPFKGRSSINAKDIIANFDLVEVNGIRNEIHVFADGTGEKIERVKLIKVSDVTWGKSASTANNVFYTGLSERAKFVDNNIIPNVISTSFDAKNVNTLYSDSKCVTIVDGLTVRYGTGLDGESTVEAFTNAYKDEVCCYELATPTVTPLTKAEVSAFLALQTYSDYTSIESDAEIDLTYYANSEIGQAVADVDSKVDEVVKDIAELEEREAYILTNEEVFVDSIDFYRLGNVVNVRLTPNGSVSQEAHTWAEMGTIPESFRPKTRAIFLTLVNYNGTHLGSLEINPTGVVRLWAAAFTNKILQLTVCYTIY